PDLWSSLAKARLFGFVAAMVSCYKGLYCKAGPKGVGDAVNQGVVITFILIFFVNFVMTTLYFALVPQKFCADGHSRICRPQALRSDRRRLRGGRPPARVRGQGVRPGSGCAAAQAHQRLDEP